MNVWSNTRTLDGHLPDVRFTADRSAADVALVGGKAFDLREFPRLRGIFKTGVGRDNVPETEARARGIVCAFPSPETAEIIYAETANFACHLILAMFYADVGDFGSWSKAERTALAAQRLLVIGAGNIGSRVAARMAAFTRVSTFDVRTNRSGELEPLLRAADCVSLHIPLSPETLGFLDAEKLGWMRDGAALVNTARAAVVAEDALFAELSAGRIRAAFDVFWEEPYSGRLLSLPPERFHASPHVASSCREFVVATAEDFHKFLKALAQP